MANPSRWRRSGLGSPRPFAGRCGLPDTSSGWRCGNVKCIVLSGRDSAMKRVLVFMTLIGSVACSGDRPTPAATAAPAAERKYLLERVDDAAVVQVYAHGFRDLSVKDKTLVWHLYQAAIAG